MTQRVRSRRGNENSYDFLFGFPLRCGFTKADVERTLGKPQGPRDIENDPDGRSVWCYFPVEIRFSGELLGGLGIGFAWWDGIFASGLESDGFFPAKGTKMETIRTLLNENNVAFEIGNDGRKLRTNAGVWIFPTLPEEDTIMTVVKQCFGGPDSFDEHFRVKT